MDNTTHNACEHLGPHAKLNVLRRARHDKTEKNGRARRCSCLHPLPAPFIYPPPANTASCPFCAACSAMSTIYPAAKNLSIQRQTVGQTLKDGKRSKWRRACQLFHSPFPTSSIDTLRINSNDWAAFLSLLGPPSHLGHLFLNGSRPPL